MTQHYTRASGYATGMGKVWICATKSDTRCAVTCQLLLKVVTYIKAGMSKLCKLALCQADGGLRDYMCAVM